MPLELTTIAAAAQRIGIATEDLAAIVQQGVKASYSAGDYLYHESTPREWLGIVLDGEVEVERGAQARTTTLATFVPGAVFSEGVMLDDSPHASSAVTRQGATIWQVSRTALDQARAEKPEVFYRIVGRIAARLSERLRYAAERIAGEKSVTVVSAFRN
jgi:aspartate ammonia-lyase